MNSYLEKVELPEALKKIETKAFNAPLKEISVIPKTTENIAVNAFVNHKLTDVYFEGTVTEWYEISYYEEYIFDSQVYIADSFNPDVNVIFGGTEPPEEPEEPEKPDEHEHIFTSGVIVEATCTENGVKSLFCICGYNYADIIYATGHKDEDGDYKCDYDCGYEFDKPSQDCSCSCHKSGFMGFIWKILKIFYKLFNTNSICACGAAHY